MLKIKDSVDLKELEKFGFKHIKNTTCEWYEYKSESLEIDIFLDKKLCILLNQYNMNYANVDILYDLIQAGLVEKVVD